MSILLPIPNFPPVVLPIKPPAINAAVTNEVSNGAFLNCSLTAFLLRKKSVPNITFAALPIGVP